jgi:nitroreductase
MATDILPELLARRSFRAIAAEPLPTEQVERLLDAALLAPSCNNNQPWRIVAVMDEKLAAVREALTEGNRWGTRAPLIVVLATKPSLDCRSDFGRDYAFFGLGMAAMALMLQAEREGLYAHPIAGYSASKVARAVGLPEDFVPLTLIIVGRHGSEDLLSDGQKEREHSLRQRKPLSEVAFRDSWAQPWGSEASAERST